MTFLLKKIGIKHLKKGSNLQFFTIKSNYCNQIGNKPFLSPRAIQNDNISHVDVYQLSVIG